MTKIGVSIIFAKTIIAWKAVDICEKYITHKDEQNNAHAAFSCYIILSSSFVVYFCSHRTMSLGKKMPGKIPQSLANQIMFHFLLHYG